MATQRSRELYDLSMKVTPGGVSSPVRAFAPYPLFIKSGKGCIITDADNNDYVDMCMAYGPLIAGHACDRVLRAAGDQMKEGTVYGAPSEPELKLIKKITETVPSAESVRLTCSGTEATMHAVRLARGYSGKDEIVRINGGFHGSHDSVLLSKGVPEATSDKTHLVEFNDIRDLELTLDMNEDVGCMIMEPVMGNSGVVLPKKGYLEEVRKLTKERGVVLIFDEVITGFRVSSGGAQKKFGVTPDLTTVGKIMGGGFPAGAFMGKKKIMDMVAPAGPVYAAGTFAGNPVSAAAGLEQIKIMCENDRYGKLEKKTADLMSCMRDHFEDYDTEGCVQGIGSMFTVFFGMNSVNNGKDANKADREMFGRMFRYMLDRGVYFPPSAMEVGFLSLAHGDDSLRKVESAFEGFLAGAVG